MKKFWILLSCVVLVFGAFGYGYYKTLGNITREQRDEKQGDKIDYKYYPSPIDDEIVDKVSVEDIITPSMELEKKIISINTGKELIEYSGKVPENMVNLTKTQLTDYFKDYGSVEFNNNKIIVTRKMPNLPNRFVLKLDGNNIVVYKTDSKGIATLYEDFEPEPHKNRDERLERGIEVDTIEKVYELIEDYE